MLKKVFTRDCPGCDFIRTREDGKTICRWGKNKKDKELIPPKGKKTPKCNLKR